MQRTERPHVVSHLLSEVAYYETLRGLYRDFLADNTTKVYVSWAFFWMTIRLVCADAPLSCLY